MTRFLWAVCCALLSMPAWAQRAKPPGCPARPAECQASLPVFDFGRQLMGSTAAPVYAHNTVTVTCTRSPLASGRSVEVNYVLKAEPAEPTRSMRNRDGNYLRYYLFLDPARTRHWGDGFQFGTFAIQGSLFLDDRNRVGTLAHVVYGKVDGQQYAQTGPMLGATVNRLEYTVNCR
jgi:spore coat protein U-like protein